MTNETDNRPPPRPGLEPAAFEGVDRRRMVAGLAGFAFFSSLTRLTMARQEEVEELPPVGYSCGLLSPTGVGYSRDHHCNPEDSACGMRSTNPLGGAWADKDCATSGSDSDCGRFRLWSGGGHPDQDCTTTGTDNACGTSAGIGSQWTDQDCTSSGLDNEHCNILDSCPIFDSLDRPSPPSDPDCRHYDIDDCTMADHGCDGSDTDGCGVEDFAP